MKRPAPDPVLVAAAERERFDSPVPLSLDHLIKYTETRGARYLEDRDLLESGYFNPRARRQPEIRVRASDSLLRRRFTLAHEYGHLLLHQQGFSLQSLEHDDEEEERWCNRFAGEMLVPTPWVRGRYSKRPETLTTLLVSASAAEVSLTTMLAAHHTASGWGSAMLTFKFSAGNWQMWSSTHLPRKLIRTLTTRGAATDDQLAFGTQDARRTVLPLMLGERDVDIRAEIVGDRRTRWVLMNRADVQHACRDASRAG
jgi:Zn-dependent peptidase ImmA (M78 family)